MVLNVHSTTDDENAANVIPGRENVWQPEGWESIPLLKIDLPPVDGIQPGDYNLTVIKITGEPYDEVIVVLRDADGNVVDTVSYV